MLAPLLGAVVERAVIQWMDPNNVATTLAVTVGLTLLFFGLVNNYLWKPTARVVPQFFGFNGFTFLGVHIDWEEVITVGAAVAIAVGLRLFLYRTRTGIAMRGVVDNRSLIGTFGGRPARLSTLSWSIGASLASVAGILVAPRLQLQPLILTLLVIDAYAAAMIGRLRSLPLTFAGALIVGLASSYAARLHPQHRGLVVDADPGPDPVRALDHPLHRPPRAAHAPHPQRHAPAPRARWRRPASSAPFRAGSCSWPRVWVAVSFMGPGQIVKLGIGLAFGLVCLSLVPLTGWGGYVSICQLTFAGLGAFAMYKFGSGGSLLGLWRPPAWPVPSARVVALPALRLRGLYLALATMAFATAHGQHVLPLVGRLRLQRRGGHPPSGVASA